MNNRNDLTQGHVGKKLIGFTLPFLLAAFLQTFYGMADLFVIGLYCGSASTSAVSIGSQVMHMLTVMIIGLAMGATVHIANAMGAKKQKEASLIIGTSLVFFTMLAIVLTVILFFQAENLTHIMMTPDQAVHETIIYLRICFIGLIFIMIYNVVSSIFRGAGDSRSPMIFVAIACVLNVLLDFVFVGGLHLGAAGAALGTICGQAVSSVVGLVVLIRKDIGITISRKYFHIEKNSLIKIFRVGIPISMQDGMIQVAFIIITIIANRRGLTASSAVGIVEKIISFLFLVPSAFLSALSAVTAQNIGAGKPERAEKSLRIALCITVGFGTICAVFNQFFPEALVGLFTKDPEVLQAGCQYIRSYSTDCAIASIHFCFSGYFCGRQKSIISFIHNIVSALCVRIPGTYFASLLFPATLFPMGMAAPAGSALSVIICIVAYAFIHKNEQRANK